jgi:hypothetical protein
MLKPLRFALVIAGLASVSACDQMSKATPQARVGYLRELVRARTVARDTLPIDGCSVNRFLDDVPAWRDSLDASELSTIVDVPPCEAEGRAVPGRFVLMEWHKNWSRDYVIRGSTVPFDQGYRFTDGIFVGQERLDNHAFYAGTARSDSTAVPSGDSMRRAGLTADSSAAFSARRDSTRRRR